MTTEQATIYAAIIAAVATILTLVVTIVGWFYTARAQRENANNQMSLDLRKQTQQIVRSEILPILWDKICKAETSVDHLLAMRIWIQLNGSHDEIVQFILENSNLTPAEQKHVFDSDNRDATYSVVESGHLLVEARQEFLDLEAFVRKNRYYFSPELGDAVERFKTLFKNTIEETSRETMYAVSNDNLARLREIYKPQANELSETIENLIRRNLNT